MKHMCLLVTFMHSMFSYHILAMFISTLLVHDFIMFCYVCSLNMLAHYFTF
ncbi:hypothetical protein HanRHA438_Chr12g0561301 [Helianthus annuus]|nr:hypothetical protein HanRHA438_Chr12g0561301 [Helianthus annuus]